MVPARGTTGAPLERGGGRACIARCRAMSIHGRAAWDYIPNPPRRSPFLGGAEGGGGGWRLLCEPTHARGGVAGGSSVRLGRETRWRPLGSRAPSRKNLGFAGGDSAIWYGMVWYGMVWYGMVWYGMVWYGMVWYGMVWYGMVWYGMVCCCCCCCCGTQHVPAGEIAGHGLPGQRAREQSAGVTLAGRVPTTTEGWGGFRLLSLGGSREATDT